MKGNGILRQPGERSWMPDGKVLASNRTVCTISVIHSQIKEPEKVIRLLAEKLEMNQKTRSGKE